MSKCFFFQLLAIAARVVERIRGSHPYGGSIDSHSLLCLPARLYTSIHSSLALARLCDSQAPWPYSYRFAYFRKACVAHLFDPDKKHTRVPQRVAEPDENHSNEARKRPEVITETDPEPAVPIEQIGYEYDMTEPKIERMNLPHLGRRSQRLARLPARSSRAQDRREPRSQLVSCSATGWRPQRSSTTTSWSGDV